MKLGSVIGRVTLSRAYPELLGARWLVVSPFDRSRYEQGFEAPLRLTKESTPVVYDSLGAGIGQTIGYVEGREAAQPFDTPTPIDAISVALIDNFSYPSAP